MAYYHKNLKYHEDKIPKRKITPEEIDFLISLQKEMNTQDTCGNADPRFWVIKGEKRIYRAENNAGGWIVIDNDSPSDILATNEKELFEYIKDELMPDINEDMGNIWEIKFDYGQVLIKNIDEEYKGTSEVVEWLNEYTIGKYEQVYYDTIDKIYSDTLFLTQKAAENHLKLNHYNYDKNAHTYAMTAWRSPEVEILWKILQEVDWRKFNE